jgi:hypothetical protein
VHDVIGTPKRRSGHDGAASPPTEETETAVAAPKTPRDIADRAVALSTGSDKDRNGGPTALIKLAGNTAEPLEQARELLVRRIRQRSDDYDATRGLSLLNSALSNLGKVDDLAWKPRVWHLPR